MDRINACDVVAIDNKIEEESEEENKLIEGEEQIKSRQWIF